MFLHCFCEDDVVQVDTNHTFLDEILEDVIHHGLEGGWTVGETKEHDQGSKESPVGAECSLPLIAFLDPDIVAPPADIQFCEVACTTETVHEVRNQWE
jgi:hypothetical protein